LTIKSEDLTINFVSGDTIFQLTNLSAIYSIMDYPKIIHNTSEYWMQCEPLDGSNCFHPVSFPVVKGNTFIPNNTEMSFDILVSSWDDHIYSQDRSLECEQVGTPKLYFLEVLFSVPISYCYVISFLIAELADIRPRSDIFIYISWEI
jgi:hypothetical protein